MALTNLLSRGACIVGVVACSTPAQELAQPAGERDTLHYVAGLGVAKLNPLLNSHGWCEVSSMIFNRLYRVSSAGQIEYDLLKSASFGEDGAELTLDLREDAWWHDGTPFTSADVIYTFDTLFDPATPTDLDRDLGSMGGWTADGPHRVIVRLKTPDPHIAGRMSEVPILPAHLLRGQDLVRASFNEHPIGTGAYKFERREFDHVVWLVAHDRYHEGAPAIKRVKVISIPDDGVRTTALWRQYDAGLIKLRCLPERARGPQPRFPGKNTRFYPSGAWRGMPINLRSETFRDRRVRRAVDLAIDREELVRVAADGLADPAFVPLVPGSWAYPTTLNLDRKPDPGEARRLLDEAGWAVGTDGFCAKEGRRLVLRLIVWKDEAFRRAAAELIDEQLGVIGIQVRLHMFDNAGYNAHAANMGDDFDAFIGGWGGLADPMGNIYRKFHTRGSQNHAGYSDSTVDQLIERAVETPDRVEAREHLTRVISRLNDEAVFLPLVYPRYAFVFSDRLDPERLPKGPIDSWYEITKHAYAWRFKD